MPIKLYNFAFGPYPQRLNIYLAEKTPANVEFIIFDEPDKQGGVPPAAVKELTPTGSLPILEDDDGTVIGQSLAILEYLEDKASGPDMLGATPTTRARIRQFVHMLDETLTFFGLWARHGSCLGHGIVRTSQDVAEICAARYFEQLRLIERMIGEEEFIANDCVTIADCVAMATLQYASDFYDVPIPRDCPKLTRWYAGFAKRPSAASPRYPEAKRAKALGLMAQTRVSVTI
ncbi:glutathione S-transferase family protein [Shinella daejeonensis]|uniref:glutathione S-transferase family protein n=1 Tax=Shinella daejeonensis TaxID=659017 RepID=UPI0020C79488|nr:glutathione S-transferase family protein [Shinella daejeonensis]MCP8896987.1 glutathione S-transferase family protein [Shinella daejeonensis]